MSMSECGETRAPNYSPTGFMRDYANAVNAEKEQTEGMTAALKDIGQKSYSEMRAEIIEKDLSIAGLKGSKAGTMLRGEIWEDSIQDIRGGCIVELKHGESFTPFKTKKHYPCGCNALDYNDNGFCKYCGGV